MSRVSEGYLGSARAAAHWSSSCFYSRRRSISPLYLILTSGFWVPQITLEVRYWCLIQKHASFNLVAAISATDWPTSLPTALQTFATASSSSSSDKAGASLSACTSCSAIAALQVKPNSLVNQVMRFSRVSEFGAIILNEVVGVCIKKASFPCHSLQRVKWVL